MSYFYISPINTPHDLSMRYATQHPDPFALAAELLREGIKRPRNAKMDNAMSLNLYAFMMKIKQIVFNSTAYAL